MTGPGTGDAEHSATSHAEVDRPGPAGTTAAGDAGPARPRIRTAESGPLPGGAVGIGWRREICGMIEALDGIGFCEVIAESLTAQRGSPPGASGRWRHLRARFRQPSPSTTPSRRTVAPHGPGRSAGRRSEVAVPEELTALIGRGIPAVPHGISLSLGGAEAVDSNRVAYLAECARALGSPLVSEHIAFVRAAGMEAGHLLPVPRTREALDALARNISRTRSELEVPLAVENIAALFEWPDAEFTEAEFLQELVERTGVHLLVDIANLYANARNRSRDPLAELLRLPTERLAYCHIAGGHEVGGRYHDTHSHPVPAEVLALVAEFTADRPVPLMLERDGNYPPAAELAAELNSIALASSRPPVTLRPALSA